MAYTINDINKEIEGMSDAEAVAFAKEACEEYGGDACKAYEDLRKMYGEDGSNELRTFTLYAFKEKVKKNKGLVIALVIVSVFLMYMIYRNYKK
jgi:hypothetical protein